VTEAEANQDFVDLIASFVEQGVNFVIVGAYAKEGKLGSVPVRFIGRDAMRRNKLAAGRPKDLLDAALLGASGGEGEG
jgi:hypothetical protein